LCRSEKIATQGYNGIVDDKIRALARRFADAPMQRMK